MSVIAFDTLTASRTLRDAGADEKLADAVVRVMSQTVELPNIDHLATRHSVELVDAKLSALKDEVSALRTVVLAGIGLNLTGLIAIGALVFAVLRQAAP